MILVVKCHLCDASANARVRWRSGGGDRVSPWLCRDHAYAAMAVIGHRGGAPDLEHLLDRLRARGSVDDHVDLTD